MSDGNYPNLIGDGHEHDAVPKLLQNGLSIVEGDLDEGHDGIRVGAHPRGADGVPKAGRPGPREIQYILFTCCVRTRNHFGFADGAER
jgi:hypothetical protein